MQDKWTADDYPDHLTYSYSEFGGGSTTTELGPKFKAALAKWMNEHRPKSERPMSPEAAGERDAALAKVRALAKGDDRG